MEKRAAVLPSPFDTLSGRAIITTFHSLAILFTIYRIVHRVRINRFSGDDWLVSLALFIMGFYVASDWVRFGMNSNHTNEHLDKSQYSAIVLKVAMSLSHAIIWCCRASLALSITRILPPGRRKTVSLVLASTCLLAGSLFIILVQTICHLAKGKGDPGDPFLVCKGGTALATAVAITDIISGVLLVIIPLHCLSRISDIAKKERRLIMILFASTTLMLIPSAVRCVYSLKQDPFALTYTSKLEVATSLILCNLVVVVTSIYQIFFRRSGTESSPESERSSPPPTITHSSEMQTQTHTGQTRSEHDRHHGHTAGSFSTDSNFAEFTRFSDMYSLHTNATPSVTEIPRA